MKIIKGFKLVKFMEMTVAVPFGQLYDSFPGMIRMNDTSADVWRWIEEGKNEEEIIAAYEETYDIPHEQAEQEVAQVIKMMQDAGVLEY